MKRTDMKNRREFIRNSLVIGAGLSLLPGQMVFGRDKMVRVGLIGVGLRGTNHLSNLLKRADVVIPAICDIDPERIAVANKLISDAGFRKPEVYTKGETAYLQLLERGDIDAVIISTPWEWHTRMAVDAMKKGKYAGVEVSAANTLQECWDLVNTHESTGVHCMLLENVCYRRDVMAVLNMVRKGLFGELIHLQCGYMHDLRNIKFEPGAEFGEKGVHEARWRTQHSVKRNGDLYPTHGIGPVGKFLDINSGNRFVSLTSVASKSRGLREHIVKKGGENHPNAKIQFNLGDVVTTMLKTSNGETVLVTHDTNLPRPYSLGFRVQGTSGIWQDDNKVFIEGRTPGHQWAPADALLLEYDHPLWKKFGPASESAGHGGMDFFVLHAFIESVKANAAPPIDVYDAAAWSAITPLSEDSIALGGTPQAFPDFTRGQWINRKNNFALSDVY